MKTKIGFYLYNKVSMQEFRGLFVKSSMYKRWQDIYRLQLSATLQQLIKSASKQDSDYQYKGQNMEKNIILKTMNSICHRRRLTTWGIYSKDHPKNVSNNK